MTRRSLVPPRPETKRCAVYTRKSTAAGLEQEFNSLDAQREACVAYIERQPGWSMLSERYDDGGFTGANTDRPAFKRLLADIEAGKIDVVVVYKVDRLSRSLLDFAKVMERFNASGASFVSVTQNFSTADSMGRLTLNMLMSFAQFEREMIGERTRDKIGAARRRGKWTGGVVPLGYTVVGKRLVVNELEAVVAREIFSLYLEHRSAMAVARTLNERRRATKRHRAANGNVREARRWGKDDVLRVLKSPVYGGYMACGKELHEAEHTAIVDRETFEQARALLAEVGGPKNDHGRNPDYLLRGLVHCACGSSFTPASTRKGTREYRYYRCVRRDKEGRGACPSAPLPADAIEGFVTERLRDVTSDGSLVDDIAISVKLRAEARRKALLVERQKLPSEIASLSTEGKRLVETIAEVNGAARRLLDDRLHEIGDGLERCETRLADVEREIANIDAVEIDATWIARCLADFDAVWDVLTPENRGRLTRAVVERVDVDEPANKLSVVMVALNAEVGDKAGVVVPEEAIA